MGCLKEQFLLYIPKYISKHPTIKAFGPWTASKGSFLINAHLHYKKIEGVREASMSMYQSCCKERIGRADIVYREISKSVSKLCFSCVFSNGGEAYPITLHDNICKYQESKDLFRSSHFL